MLCPRVRKGGPWCLLVPYESDFRASSLARLKNLRSFHRAPFSHIMRATVDGRERFRNMAGEMTCASQKYADHGSGSCPHGPGHRSWREHESASRDEPASFSKPRLESREPGKTGFTPPAGFRLYLTRAQTTEEHRPTTNLGLGLGLSLSLSPPPIGTQPPSPTEPRLDC